MTILGGGFNVQGFRGSRFRVQRFGVYNYENEYDNEDEYEYGH